MPQSGTPPASPNARRHARIPYREVVLILPSGASRSITAVGQDLSVGGVGVSVEVELPIGVEVSAWISSVVEVEMLRCDAMVRYRRGRRHGLEFRDLTAEQLEILDRTCRAAPRAIPLHSQRRDS